MKCENDKELITRWINNELSEAERNAFEIHIAGCAECRQELKATEAVWSLMGRDAGATGFGRYAGSIPGHARRF